MADIDISLDALVADSHRSYVHQRQVANSTWRDRVWWADKITRNIDLFTTSFIELNIMVLTYPLNTIKTRIQAHNLHTDVAKFQKNGVDKARNFFR